MIGPIRNKECLALEKAEITFEQFILKKKWMGFHKIQKQKK